MAALMHYPAANQGSVLLAFHPMLATAEPRPRFRDRTRLREPVRSDQDIGALVNRLSRTEAEMDLLNTPHDVDLELADSGP